MSRNWNLLLILVYFNSAIANAQAYNRNNKPEENFEIPVRQLKSQEELLNTVEKIDELEQDLAKVRTKQNIIKSYIVSKMSLDNGYSQLEIQNANEHLQKMEDELASQLIQSGILIISGFVFKVTAKTNSFIGKPIYLTSGLLFSSSFTIMGLQYKKFLNLDEKYFYYSLSSKSNKDLEQLYKDLHSIAIALQLEITALQPDLMQLNQNLHKK